jgi:hypothetical protein
MYLPAQAASFPSCISSSRKSSKAPQDGTRGEENEPQQVELVHQLLYSAILDKNALMLAEVVWVDKFDVGHWLKHYLRYRLRCEDWFPRKCLRRPDLRVFLTIHLCDPLSDVVEFANDAVSKISFNLQGGLKFFILYRKALAKLGELVGLARVALDLRNDHDASDGSGWNGGDCCGDQDHGHEPDKVNPA